MTEKREQKYVIEKVIKKIEQLKLEEQKGGIREILNQKTERQTKRKKQRERIIVEESKRAVEFERKKVKSEKY